MMILTLRCRTSVRATVRKCRPLCGGRFRFALGIVRSKARQKYYYKDNERAKKFFEQAITAADIVMGSGKYAIDVDFRTLFGSMKAPEKNVSYIVLMMPARR